MVGQLDAAYSSMEKKEAAYVPSVAEYGKKRRKTWNIGYAAGCICGVGLAAWMVYITLMVNKDVEMGDQQPQVLGGPHALNYSGPNMKQGMEIEAMKNILVHMAQEQASSRLDANPDEMQRRTARLEGDPPRRNLLSKLECCSSPDGLPPRPRIVLLGETGVGKSTLGNRLFGKKPGMCASANSMLNQTHPQLGVGHGPESHTNETAWVAGKWLGDNNSSCFTVIDTPGVGDVEGRDCEHGMVISEAIKNLGQVDAFVLMFKGTQSRFTKPLQDQLSLYQEMFGVNFWKRIIIEISFWRSSNYAKEERLDDREIDEGRFTDDLNNQLKDKFGLTRTIPVYFIDPMYTQRRGRRNAEEKETFEKETEKLWNFTQSGDPYTCEGHCKSPGFLEGKPILKSENVNATVGAKVIMDFSIWFAGCDGKGDRDYDIFKDGVHIWTVIDEQGEKGKEKKPKQMTEFENTPPHMKVFDGCSQSIGSRMDCNIELSKYKNVRVVFRDITEDGFGSYYVSNTNGRSEEVHIQKKTDGFYSEWTEWSVWKKESGAKERTRVCTEPVNGGLPCQGGPTDWCNNDKCAEPSTYSRWSDWKCQEVCSIPTNRPFEIPSEPEKRTNEIRTRTCTDSKPVHSIHNCAMMGRTTENSGLQCGGRSHVPRCPDMKRIKTEVCDIGSAGTDDNVRIEFKNGLDETCITHELDKKGDDFERGKGDTWGEEHLKSCTGDSFRPIGGLRVRFRTNTHASNVHHDDVDLCAITAQFGWPDDDGYSKWEWEANSSSGIGNLYYSTYNSQSEWVTMSKDD